MSETEKKSETLQLQKEEQPKIHKESKNDLIPENTKEKKEEIITTRKEIKYGEIPYRWFFLVSYCLSGFVNQVQWVAYSAISTAFSDNYDKPLWKVNMFSCFL